MSHVPGIAISCRLLAALVILAGCTDVVSVGTVNIFAGAMIFDGPGVVQPDDTVPVRIVSYAIGNVRQWKVRVYLSSNPVISAEDISLGDFTAVRPAMNGPWSAASTMGTTRIPAGTPAGRYFLAAVIDPDDQLPDSTREDNTIRASLPLWVGTAPSRVAEVPALLAPADHAVIPSGSLIALSWGSVTQAAFYHVEVDQCPTWTDSTSWWNSCATWFIDFYTYPSGTSVSLLFPPNQLGRWRVRGVDSLGIGGPASPWQTFQVN